MKLYSFAINVLVLLFVASSSFAGSINWKDYSPTVLDQAKKSNRPTILYAKSSECKWCKKMGSTTMVNAAVTKTISNNFEAIVLNIDNTNLDTAAQLGITELPTIIIYDKDGNQAQTLSGYTDSKKMLQDLNSVIKP